MKFRFVQEHRETFRVGMMCKVLKVSRGRLRLARASAESDASAKIASSQAGSMRSIARAGRPTARLGSTSGCAGKERRWVAIAWPV